MSQNDEAVWIAAIAGLLHDMGKFRLRAGRGGHRTWDEQARADFKYKHAMLSVDAVQECVPEVWRARVAGPVGNHHRPRQDTVIDLAVALADHLSAAERDSDTPDDAVDRKVKAVHPQQLLSIFAQLKADGESLDDKARETAYWPLQPLKMAEEILFPGAPLDGDAVWKAYESLYGEFEQAAAALRQAHEREGDLDAFLESLLLLMQRITWAVPAAYYKATPDISLYDHSRTTAALAALLVAEGHAAATLQAWVNQPKSQAEMAVLVAADLSGVQDFLYTISSRGATSALRGRSFYLQMLTEAVARYVLRRLGLPITNLLYAGGGNFYLLIALRHQAQLAEIQREVSRVLLQHHRGALYFALATTPLRGVDFFDGKISAAWQRASDELQQRKTRRFSELDGEELAWLFKPQEDGGNEDRECQVCGLEHPDTQKMEETRKCPACRGQEALGKDLRNAKFLLLQQRDPVAPALGNPPGAYREVLAAFGLELRLGEKLDEVRVSTTRRATLLALSDEALSELQPAARLAVGRRFLANAAPILSKDDADRLNRDPNFQKEEGEFLRAGEIKPFNALAYDAAGIKRLGVLRMDVDNLGKLFSQGLGKQATLSRVASLSFAVSLYFEGWVDYIARTPEFCEHLYCIYSGGDDLFFVGAWDKVVTFGQRVRADFSRYVAGHPGLHTSAGIALAGSKYPLAQAAEDAGDAEQKAKKARYRVGNQIREKDAVCFLGAVQPWARFGLDLTTERDLTTAHGMMRFLVGMVQTETSAAPRSLVRQLVRLALDYEEALERRRKEGSDRTRTGEAQALWGPWLWQGVYQLARMTSRAKNPAVKQDIERLRKMLGSGESVDMAWIGLAARWAELALRRRERDDS